MNARKTLGASLVLALSLMAMLAPPVHAEYAIHGLEVSATNRDGSVDQQAGSHPYEYVVHFGVNLDSEGGPEGRLSHVLVDLPPGFIGNPQALPTCSDDDFEGTQANCPGATQIGVFEADVYGLAYVNVPIYNVAPPQGVAAGIGLSVFGITTLEEAFLRPSDYGVSVADITVPTTQKIQSVTERIWGEPSDPGHDPVRTCRNQEGKLTEGDCSIELASGPYITLPTSCSGPMKTTATIYSIEEPTVPRTETVESLGSGGNPAGLTGCGRPPFDPSLEVRPETTAADSATGLHTDIHIPQNDELGQIASAHLKNVTLALPKGLTLDPSTAAGLTGCSEAQAGLGTSDPIACPAASKVGTVKVETPVFDHPLLGSVYIAKQGENPFGTLVGLYLAIEDPARGIVVKIPGKVEPDPTTGQVSAIFKENPQVPFEDLQVDFQGGPRAALTMPPVCGTYNTTSDLTPWTSPEGADASPSDSFKVTEAAGGGACATSEAATPNPPSFEAGTVSPLGGHYSPFVLKLSRENGSQQLRALNLTLPPGLTGKLAGLQECSTAQIAVAEGRKNPGDGALEKSSPSCPQSSEIGVVNVGAGSGSPLYVQGHAYLAGAYKGAPLSMVIITPAVAGPFDLGTVVVRAALYVNESTAQISVKSDPIPTILQGIPLDVRSIAVQINRNEFTLNPTSCEPKSVLAEAISPFGAAPLSQRFQVGGCKGLDFAPKLALSFKGSTKRGKNPALKAVLTQPAGEANISKVSVVLPQTEFIDNRHINNPCTRVQFNAGAGNGAECPAKSILGHAKAFTPLLDKPLEGPVYFRSNGGERELPDLVASLNGQVHLNVVGFVDSVQKKGSETSRVRNTFASVPDAPVSKFILELKGGKQGLLQNSANLCQSSNVATAKLNAQNGKSAELSPTIANSCKGGGKKGKAKKGKAGKSSLLGGLGAGW
jgi:hypothetical protein